MEFLVFFFLIFVLFYIFILSNIFHFEVFVTEENGSSGEKKIVAVWVLPWTASESILNLAQRAG